MRMDKNFKPELVYATDARAYFQCPFLDIETDKEGIRVGRIVATDGKRFVIIPVELDDRDTEGSIPISAFVLARKASGKFGLMVIFCLEGVCRFVSDETIPRPDYGKYPDWRKLPELARPPVTQEISFDPVLFSSLVKAMGASNKITLKISGEGKAIYLVGGTPLAENAILMPMA